MMNEEHGNMDEEVLAEIIALAEKLMGDKMGSSEKPSMISMEVSKAEPMEEAVLEELVEEKSKEAPAMASKEPEGEDEDEFELRKNKRIF